MPILLDIYISYTWIIFLFPFFFIIIETITYTEDILVSTSPTKQETSLSDLATKVLFKFINIDKNKIAIA